MDDFSMPIKNVSKDVPPPAPANFIVPGKRPLSSMSPTIALKVLPHYYKIIDEFNSYRLIV
jgi:gamma-glutamyltranspeptidase